MKLWILAVVFFVGSVGFSTERKFRSAQFDIKLSYLSVDAERSFFVVKKTEVRFSNDGFCAFFTEQGEIPCEVNSGGTSFDWWPIINISKLDFVNLLGISIQDHSLKSRALEIISSDFCNIITLGQFRDITPDRYYEGPFPSSFTDPKSQREVVNISISSNGLTRL